MLILSDNANDANHQVSSIVAVLGVGLIGIHLVQTLYKHSYMIAYRLPFSWDTSALRPRENTMILHCIHALLNARKNTEDFQSDSRCRIDVVWSAGKGGFSMPECETQLEIESFSDVLRLADTIAERYTSCMVRFHMLSSAGGLFEGQRNVGCNTVPCAKRPYASMKLKQEQILGSYNGIIPFIYRPTSVYGFGGLNRRLGLIPTLLYNGLKNKVSSIFGTPDTLRDYVWANDIGSFITNIILSKISTSKKFTLASGKPSSLFEILNYIEILLNKKIFCHYIKNGGNAEHNTFSKGNHPNGWNPTDLKIGILKTYHAML